MQNNIRPSTLRDYMKVIFKQKIIFAVVPLAILIPVYFTLQLVTPKFQSSVKLYVKAQKETEADYYKGIFSLSITSDHAELVTSNIVLARVVEALKLYEIPIDHEKKFASPFKAALIEQRMKRRKIQLESMTAQQRKSNLFMSAMENLKNNLTVLPVRDTSFFMIQVRDFDPKLVTLIANSVSRSYVIFDLEQQVQEYKLKYGSKHSTVLQLEDYIEDLKGALHGELISDIDALGPASVKIIAQAQYVNPVISLNKSMLLILSFFVAVFFSLVFAFMLEYFDNTLKSQHDIETTIDAPFLGSIPKSKSKDKLLIGNSATEDRYAKALQDVAHQIYLLTNDKKFKSILIFDIEGSEDVSLFIANISMCLADHSGQRVLIIDANLRKPSISNILDVPNEPGLSNVLEKEITFENAIQSLSPSLNVLSTGKIMSNPNILLGSSDMSVLIDRAKEKYDLVFIKCGDIKNYMDSVILSSVVDGVMLVVNEGKVRKQVISQALVPLRQNKSNFMGVVMNNCIYAIPEFLYRIT